MIKITLLLVTGIAMSLSAAEQKEPRTIKVGQIYKHYKGNLYKVFAIAVDTEAGVIHDHEKITDSQRRVIYYALDNKDLLWDRPYEMFAEKIIIDDIEQPRFAEYEG